MRRRAHSSRLGWTVVRRLGDLVIVALLVVTLTGLLIQLAPGDPARSILGEKAPAESVAALRAQLNLDDSIFQQIATWIGHAFTGDLGHSLASGMPVTEIIGDALPVTGTIVLGAVVISLLVGVPLGLLAAISHGRWPDRVINVFAISVLSVPAFAVALLLILGLALTLHLAPTGGWGDGWPGNLRYAWLPSVALAALVMPQVLRTTRESAAAVIGSEFMDAAEARGLSRGRIVVSHLLPNSILPVIAVVGFNASALIGGAVVIEAVFGLPGLGQVLTDAVGGRDYPLLQGVALVSALIVVLLNLLTDVLYAVADPRVRVSA